MRQIMTEKKVILVVLAHPDDETFGMGGTLALYAQKGVEVNLVCATRGEVGDVPAEMMKGHSSVAELREHELMEAAAILGLSHVDFLGYRDSGMPGSPDNHHPQALAAAPLEEVATKVVQYIRKYRPQIVLTFDPIGGYRHPDHIAIQQATEKAFYTAGDPAFVPGEFPAYTPAKLYFHTMPKTALRMGIFFMRLMGKDPRKFGRNQDIDLVSIAEVSFPIHAVIRYYAVADLRDRAAACHASQGGTQITSGGVIGRIRQFFGAKDLFMRAFPAPTRHIEKDLFEGLD
ncbi:MAG: GlcNAc-PI de-N-acetylase [Anaerolineaceae bacterium]|nr:GlcNAc-PI de-N-acetylase [Anaerolineaceae bacterium]